MAWLQLFAEIGADLLEVDPPEVGNAAHGSKDFRVHKVGAVGFVDCKGIDRGNATSGKAAVLQVEYLVKGHFDDLQVVNWTEKPSIFRPALSWLRGIFRTAPCQPVCDCVLWVIRWDAANGGLLDANTCAQFANIFNALGGITQVIPCVTHADTLSQADRAQCVAMIQSLPYACLSRTPFFFDLRLAVTQNITEQILLDNTRGETREQELGLLQKIAKVANRQNTSAQ